MFLSYTHTGVFTINLESSPSDIAVNLTSDLTLTCEVDTGTSSSAGLVGRDTTNQGEDIKFLSSLVVMRNGKDHVASITEHTPATALLDRGNLKVTGHLSGNKGILQLKWRYPTTNQASEYTCEGNGITANAHNVQVTTSINIKTQEPQLNDLVQYIHNQQVAIEQLLTKKIPELESALLESRHIETGVINCGSSSTWAGCYTGSDAHGYTLWYDSVAEQFARKYQKPPVVHLSVQKMWSKGTNDRDTIYYIDLMTVNESGFDMRCRSFHDDRIRGMRVTWISIPQ